MTIPASEIVSVNPDVLGTGGNPLALNGVMMSKSLLLPSNGVQSFGSDDAVGDFFGLSSPEYALAGNYFLGFDGSSLKPGTLYFAPFADANRAAWLQSGSFKGATLADIQALTGLLTLSSDGTPYTSSAINLATATSFTDAATKITAALTGAGKPICTWNAVNNTFVFTSATTGAASTITFATNTLATGLKFTSATGAILSQGVIADTPTTAMANVVATTQNWVDFMTLWEPDTATKTLFAIWTNAQNQRYAYIVWDTDAQAGVNGSTTNFGYLAKTAGYDGVVPVYNTPALAAFILGTSASIDFSQTNGRITAAFKSQAGLPATVTDQQLATNLLANGYSFYGIYATANDRFTFLYNGQMTGKWKWLDPFLNQVYLNSQFQLKNLSLLTQVNSVPYNQPGYTLIRATMMDPVNEGLNFGSIRPGVKLSQEQAAILNSEAGRKVDKIVETDGYYLQILDPTAQVRGNRGTPVINFWYTDGGAVQKINVASIDIF